MISIKGSQIEVMCQVLKALKPRLIEKQRIYALWDDGLWYPGVIAARRRRGTSEGPYGPIILYDIE